MTFMDAYPRRPSDDIYHVPGWASGELLDFLADKAGRSRVSVEIGTYEGKSAFTMAKFTPGVVYCVDSWTRDIEDALQEGMIPSIAAYHHFIEYAIQFGYLGTKIFPIACPSNLAWRMFEDGPKIDLLYIDGWHTYPAPLEDITLWSPFMSSNGIVCGDDWPMPSVKRSVREYAEAHGMGISLHADEHLWMLERA